MLFFSRVPAGPNLYIHPLWSADFSVTKPLSCSKLFSFVHWSPVILAIGWNHSVLIKPKLLNSYYFIKLSKQFIYDDVKHTHSLKCYYSVMIKNTYKYSKSTSFVGFLPLPCKILHDFMRCL